MAIVATDLLVLQRLDTSSADPDLYKGSVQELATFVGQNLNVTVTELTELVDQHTDEILAINNSLTTIVASFDLLRLDVDKIDTKLGKVSEKADKNEVAIEEILVKAKTNLNYLWVRNLPDNPDDLEPGTMSAEYGDTGEVVAFYYSSIDSDGIPANQPFIFEGETLEITSSYDPMPDQPSKLRHRSVYVISQPVINSKHIEIPVEQRHQFGDYPYSEGDETIYTRSDFYPNVLELEELQEDIEATYFPLNASKKITGNVTIDRGSTTSKLNLTSTKDSVINATTALKFTLDNSFKVTIDDDGFKFQTAILANGYEIQNIGAPTTGTSAATRDYVDTLIDQIESEIEDTFSPGDTVAKSSSSGVEVGGLYLQNNTLYVRVS